jgi:hypothetical protein
MQGAHRPEQLTGLVVQRFQALDRNDAQCKFSEQRRLIAAAGTDLEHSAEASRSAHVGAIHQQLDHPGDH